MSDFSSDVSGQTLNITSKAIEGAINFFKYLLERKGKNAELKMNQLRIRDIKDVQKQKDALRKIEGSAGYVKAQLLLRSGERLTPIGTEFNKAEIKRFNEHLKRYGVPASNFSKSKDTEGKKRYTILVREKDLATIQKIIEKMVIDEKITAIDEKINELEGRENLTDTELKDLEILKNEKEKLVSEVTESFNSINENEIFESVCKGLEDKSKEFHEALNHITDRDYSRPEPYYICDRKNPNNYIECLSTRENFRDEEYTKTDYKVYKDNVEVMQANDGRFEGREPYYWPNLRKEMKKNGDFSNDVVIFNSKEEFSSYKQLFQAHLNNKNLQQNVNEINTDTEKVTNELKSELSENGVVLTPEGKAIDKKSGAEINVDELSRTADKLKAAESTCIANLISCYDSIAETETNITLCSTEIEDVNKSIIENTKQLTDLSQIHKEKVHLYEGQINSIKEEIAGIVNKFDLSENEYRKKISDVEQSLNSAQDKFESLIKEEESFISDIKSLDNEFAISELDHTKMDTKSYDAVINSLNSELHNRNNNLDLYSRESDIAINRILFQSIENYKEIKNIQQDISEITLSLESLTGELEEMRSVSIEQEATKQNELKGVRKELSEIKTQYKQESNELNSQKNELVAKSNDLNKTLFSLEDKKENLQNKIENHKENRVLLTSVQARQELSENKDLSQEQSGHDAQPMTEWKGDIADKKVSEQTSTNKREKVSHREKNSHERD